VFPRWLLFGVALASLVLLTYAGVLFAFSVPVTEDLAAGEPSLTPGTRAVTVPISGKDAVHTLSQGGVADILVWGDSSGFPASTQDTRIGRAALYVPANANGTVQVGNSTLDLATFSGGVEGWIVQTSDAPEPWFSARDITVGKVNQSVTSAELATLLAGGMVGFIAPLVFIVLTHRGGKPTAPGGPPSGLCRECRAPLATTSTFCTRCGAWNAAEGPR
jgi:hypothetical protein